MRPVGEGTRPVIRASRSLLDRSWPIQDGFHRQSYRLGRRHPSRHLQSGDARVARHRSHGFADDGVYLVTIYVTDKDTATGHASFTVTVNNVAPTIAISGAASVNEGSAYSLTLGAVTDPGTDTVTSYIVHWGDGNSEHLQHRGAKATPTPTARPATRSRSTWSTRTAPSSIAPTRFSVTVNNVAPDDRDQRRRQRQRGLGLQPDPGRGHRPGHRHRHAATSSTGATATPTPTHRRRQDATPTPTAPTATAITVDLIDEDGTFLDRANALVGHGQQRGAHDRDQRRRQRQRGLGLQPDPGRGHRPGHRHRHAATSSTGATATRAPTAPHGAKTHTYADGPDDHGDHGRPGRRGRHLPRSRQRARRSRSTTWRPRSRSAAPPASTRARPTA